MIISSAPSKPASAISSKVSSSENMKNGPVAASTGGTGWTWDKIAPRGRQAGRTAEARGGCYQATEGEMESPAATAGSEFRPPQSAAGLDFRHGLAAPGRGRGRLGGLRRRGPAPVRR